VFLYLLTGMRVKMRKMNIGMFKVGKIAIIVLVFGVLFLVVGGVNGQDGEEDPELKYEWEYRNVNLKTNIEVRELSGSKGRFFFEEDSVLKITHKGKLGERTYSGLEDIDGEDSYLVFDKDGKMIEGEFKTSKQGEFILGNEIVLIPAGSEVRFKDGEAVIKVSNKIIDFDKVKPRVVDGKKGETAFIFTTGANSIKHEGLNFKELGYYDGKYFFPFLGNYDEINFKEFGFHMYNKDKVRVYFDFKGEVDNSYQGAYVSFNKDKGVFVTGSNVNENGPAIQFTPSNVYGLNFDQGDSDNLMIQALGNDEGNWVRLQKSPDEVIRNSQQKIVPKIDGLNQFAMHNNGHAGFFNTNTEKFYLRPNKGVIKGFENIPDKTTSVAVTVNEVKMMKGGEETKPMGNYKVGWSNFNEANFGLNSKFIQLGTYRGVPGLYRGVSDLEAYNYELTEEAFERIAGIRLVSTNANGKDFIRGSESKKNIKYLFDLIANMPPEQVDMVRTINLGHGKWAYGYATTNGMQIYLTVHRPGSSAAGSGFELSPRLFAHEMAHIVDYNGGSGGFNRDWYRSGLNGEVTTSGYSHKGGESISEFVGFFQYGYPGTINKYMNGNRAKSFRRAVVIATKHHFFTRNRMEQIFRASNLPYDDKSISAYLNKQNVGNIQYS